MQPSIDLFVHLAHQSPMAAIAQLDRHRSLSRATSSWGETALQAASHLGHRKLIARLLECGLALDVFAAAALGNVSAVSAMVASGPKDLCGVHYLPPLHTAAGIGSKPMVRALVSAGADVSFTDAFGQTALDWAYDLRVTDSEMLELLGAPNVRVARRSA